MKPRFAWSLPVAEARALGAVRRWSGLEALMLTAPTSSTAAATAVWIRAASLEDEQWECVRRLPGADRFTVLDDGQLVPVGALVPRGRLPEGAWQPLDRWLAVELPPAESAIAAPTTAPLQLVRSTIERSATWLQTTLEAWTDYAVVAPQVRLARWSFAADARGRVVVRGAPLPPLPGLQFAEQEGIAVPLGWTWYPHVSADVVREAFGLSEGECIVWTPDGACERIAADDWVQATRSAARQTEAAARR